MNSPTPPAPVVPVWKRILTLAGPLVFIAMSPGLPAADKPDLERTTPVPPDQRIPIQDFFRPRLLEQPKLNLSGTHVAAIMTNGTDRHDLLVYEFATKKVERTGGQGDMDVYEVHWLNDTRLVFGLSARKLYGLGLFAADVGRISDANPLLQYYGTSLLAIPPKNRLHPLVWNSRDGIDTSRDLGAAVVNTDLRVGQFTNLAVAGVDRSAALQARDTNQRHIETTYPVPGGGLTYRYLADRDGQLAFAFTSQQGAQTLQQFTGGEWKACPVDLENIDVVSAGDEPGQLVVLGPRQDGKPRALQFMDAATGRLGEVLIQDQAYDFNGWIYRSPATQAIIGAMFDRNGPRTIWFNEDYRNLQKILDGFFPGLVVRIIGSNEVQNFFLVATFSDRQPVIYNWVDLTKRTAGTFQSSAPWIDPKRMQPMNTIKFKTRDGRSLDAYVTLPAGATKANPPPLVVLCHGGPWARDIWGFNPEVQMLANRGYAVLQPNYRGSTGTNWLFPLEDEWDFRKMHDDVTAATKALIGSGLVDPKRVGIMGSSFGGYLAISGVVNEPDLYRCAVTNAGVFDWERQIKDSKFRQYDSPVFGRLLHKLGDPEQQPAKFEAISPGRHVERIRVPVFVAGGRDDQTVEITQSRDLISALEKNHVPHETLIIGDEAHGMAHFESQLELYTRIEAFLEKNLR